MNFLEYSLIFSLVIASWVVIWELCDKALFPLIRPNTHNILYSIILILIALFLIGIIYTLKNNGISIALF